MKQVCRKISLVSISFLVIAGHAALPLGSADAAQQPIRVLILSGENNHDWRATTPQLKEILLRDGRFTVEVTDHPENLDESAAEEYDVLLSNWNSWGDSGVKDWAPATRDAFLEFVREGRGLVVVHAGSSSFVDWGDYQNLVGGTWGKETGHGAVHTFTVRMVDGDHPITRGLQPFPITDELWHHVSLRSVKVLATAFSAAEKGGSGKDEPVAFTTSFGEGRCFNLVLGHDVGAMKAPGFQILLRRGAEWAGRNEVTIPARPSDDPALLESILQETESYRFGASRAPLLRVESLVASAGTRGGPKVLAEALAKKLKSTGATVEAKKFFCEQLSLIGTDEQVPALASVLSDSNLFYEVVMALQRIPGAEPRRVLLEALPSAPSQQQVVLISALGARGERESVPGIAQLAASSDPAVSTAALRTLGRIDGEEGLKALAELEKTVPVSNRLALRRAQLSAARRLVEQDNLAAVRPLLKQLLAPDEPSELQAAALLLDAAVPEASTATRLLEALSSDNPVLREAAVSGLKLRPNRDALFAAARELKDLAPESQALLLTALEEVDARPALPAVLELVRLGETEEVRSTALSTIAALGDEAAIKPLLQLLAKASAAEKAQVVSTLARLPGAGVDHALLAAFETADVASQPSLVEALVARNPEGLPKLLLALESPEPSVRVAAARGLEKVGTVDSAPGLLRRLRAAPEAEAALLESALAQLYRREKTLGDLDTELARADNLVKPRLLNVAASVGGPDALRLIEKQTGSPDPEVALAALRLLAEWTDPMALNSLCSLAESAADNRSRTLAIRGITRLAPQAQQEPRVVADTLARVLPRANAAETKQLLGALGELPGGAGLPVLRGYLTNVEVGAEARLAALKALEAGEPGPDEQAKAVLTLLKHSSPDASAKERLQVLDWKYSDLPNLSSAATATSTTGLSPDGQGGPAPAAIDGNLQTYWDETDNQKLYVLRLELKQPARIGFLRFCGWKHHEYAPKDFEVLCDGKPAAKVESARYVNNWLTVGLNGIECRVIELRIHGYYAASPAIRELEIRGRTIE